MIPLHGAPPEARSRSQLGDFARFAAAATGRRFDDYRSLHAFSIEDVGRFWALFLAWSGILAEGDASPATAGAGISGLRFFPGVRLSWAENVLAPRDPDAEARVAVVSVDENGARRAVTRGELRARVRRAAAGLESLGIGPGDRVAAVARNTLETLVACLSVTSLGATWSSLPMDMGRDAVLARLAALGPSVLFAHASSRHNGALLRAPLADAANALPGLRAIVGLDDEDPEEALRRLPVRRVLLGDLESAGSPGDSLAWRRFAFDHPLFVLFSSGTTGSPKAIVHGHGGTLLEHLKEHRLHCDLGPGDALCFQTSTGWMMWNWTLSALAAGARLVLYDGSVSYPDRDAFLSVAEREAVTVLGLSPAYLHYLVDARIPAAHERLRALRLILSTGSVLTEPLHRWAKEHLSRAPLESISGGTDLLGCFVLGSPWCDTYAGECSSIGLGMDVRAADPTGAIRREGSGALVCVQPFPSRPVAFLDDADGERLERAYYAEHAGAWTHGDLVEITPRATVRVIGRCDGVLNIRGIRIGPAEIYDVLHRAIPEIAQAMAVDADAPEEPGARRLLLLVVLRRDVTLDRALVHRIKRELKERASAAHVPAAVVPVDELPMTYSGKLSEAAMQDALSGRPVRNLNALRNPEAIAKAIEALGRA